MKTKTDKNSMNRNKENSRKIMILNGSFCEMPMIQIAAQMGYYVITTGNMPQLVGHPYADEYINVDYSDKERILELAKRNHVERVISCANDFGVLTASYVAEKMGWPGHDSYKTAMLLHHKDQFRYYAEKHQIPIPDFAVFTDSRQAKSYVQSVSYPVIVKANDLTGGKGIRKAQNAEEAEQAIDYAFLKSRDKHIVIESFIEGTQHTIVAFLVRQKVRVSISCNCYSPVNPYLIQSETIPADAIELLQPQLYEIMENMAQNLQLADGIIALQYILRDGKIYILETMRRCFGNQFLTLASLATGFPWEEAQLKAEMGESCEGIVTNDPAVRYCGHHGVMAYRNGVVCGYEIAPSIQKHIFKKIEMIPPGERLKDYLNERVAYIYYAYDDKLEMLEAVKHFHKDIRVCFSDESLTGSVV